ncbi:hypothetical protein [Shewanella woodyi]|uniref:hypothetical protein n=1 Tax=Shewanella woodyi TaxID=60961 RepID=UPI0007E99F3B|nr:hypothetical protein [Shewanella woodyi]
MKNIRRILFILMASIAMPVFAGSQTGLVTNINVRDDGLHWFTLSGDRGVMPACTRDRFTYWMIKDESSTYGKSQFSMLLAAYMAQKTVTIIGTGSCTRWGDGEDIKVVQFK